MERLVNICLLLALIFVRFSLQKNINVTVTPNNGKIFYSEFGKNLTKNITCESDCPNCTHTWYRSEGNDMKCFEKGKKLFLNEVVRRNYTFICRVLASYRNFTDSSPIKVIIRENGPTTITPRSVSLTQQSLNTVFFNSTSLVKYVENDDSFPRNPQFVIIGICAVAGLLLIIVVVIFGIFCAKTKEKPNKTRKESRKNSTTQEKDHGLELTENTLYITADNVAEMPPSNPAQNVTTRTESGNDVYAVVNKTKKNEKGSYTFILYLKKGKEKLSLHFHAVCEDETRMEKKPIEEEKNKPGQTVNKDGMVYVEIDFKDMPSNEDCVLQGAENKTLYVDIESVKHADPLPKNDEEGNHDSQQNVKE